jgi:hypothetical protein
LFSKFQQDAMVLDILTGFLKLFWRDQSAGFLGMRPRACPGKSKEGSKPWGREYGGVLLELGIFFIVVGLLWAGILGMRSFVHKARMHTTIQKVQLGLYAVAQFQEVYDGAMPGALADGAARLGAEHNGRGVNNDKGLDSGNDCAWAWDQLAGADLIERPGSQIDGVPVMKLSFSGGLMSLICNEEGYFFELGSRSGKTTGGPLFTLAQANELASRFPQSYVRKVEDGKKGAASYSVRIFIGRSGG